MSLPCRWWSAAWKPTQLCENFQHVPAGVRLCRRRGFGPFRLRRSEPYQRARFAFHDVVSVSANLR